MEKEEILQQVQEIFRNVLDNPEIQMNVHTTASDVEGWDSLTHIQLVVAIEKHFHIKFSTREILSWKNVGEMIESICHKC